MKIISQHYEYMKQAIKNCPVSINQARLNILNSDRQPKNFDMRLRWDMFHLAGLSKYACDTLYSYCNDDHIDTALKSIMKELDK